MEKRSAKLIKNTAILGVGTILSKAVMFFLSPLLTRWISQDAYGNYDLVVTYTSLLVPLFTLSVGEGVFRFLLEKEKLIDKKKIVSTAIIIELISMMIGALGIILVSLFVPLIQKVLWVFITLIVIQALYTLNLMIARGLKNIREYTVGNIIFTGMLLISCIVAVKILHGELKGALISYIVGYLTASLYLFFRLKIYKYISRKYFDLKVSKEILKYSAPLIPNSVAWWVVNVSDRTIVSLILGATSNAILAVANKVPNICQTIFSVFHISWQEAASESINDADKERYYSKVMNDVFQIIASICILIIGCNFLIFKILFTEEYAEAALLSPMLIMAIVFSIMGQFYGGIYIAQKNSKANGITTVMAAFINIIVHLSLIWGVGIYAAPISTFVAYLALYIIRHIDMTMRKKMKLRYTGKTALIAILLIYFFGMTYVNNMIVDVVNLIFAMTCFMLTNKNMIFKLLKKIKRK